MIDDNLEMMGLATVLSDAQGEAGQTYGARPRPNSASPLFIREAMRAVDHELPRRQVGRPRKPRAVVADMVARRTRGDSLEEIGSAYGVTKQAIFKLLKTHVPELFETKEEVQAKEQVRQSDLEQVCNLWRKGLQRRQIARELGMTPGRVKYLLSYPWRQRARQAREQ